MKLLIVTQKVDINDPILGFFHGWVIEFAKKYEKLTVICLEKGKYSLPPNVSVYSLGKESVVNRNSYLVTRFKYISNFFRLIWRERKNYDSVFVHMNPEYIFFGGLFWRLLGKKILLWYIHPKSSMYLWFSRIFVYRILTASKSTFPLPSKKVFAVGHGIDTDKFKMVEGVRTNKPKNSIIFVGRISKIKNIDVFIEALKVLDRDHFSFTASIVGGADTSQKEYLLSLKGQAKELETKGKIKFIGEVSQVKLIDLYNQNELLVNLTKAGSFDKVVLEAVLCGLSVITTNKAFKDVLSRVCFCENLEPNDLARKIKEILNLEQLSKEEIIKNNISNILENHSLKKLPEKIIKIINETSR